MVSVGRLNTVTPKIRIIHGQCGMTVEASIDGGNTWQMVQSGQYRTRKSNGTRPYRTYIDPARDESEYFEQLTKRGIAYQRV